MFSKRPRDIGWKSERMKRTYIDTNVFISAFQGEEQATQRAMRVLDDPDSKLEKRIRYSIPGWSIVCGEWKRDCNAQHFVLQCPKITIRNGRCIVRRGRGRKRDL